MIMGLDTTHPGTKHPYRTNSSGPQSCGPRRGIVDERLYPQVEAVVPRLTSYARVLARDPAAADDLVQDCLDVLLL